LSANDSRAWVLRRLSNIVSEQLRAELRATVDGGGPGARHAEVALGGGPVRQRLLAAMQALADHRGPNSSTCPSDAARAVGGENWRERMDEARALARELASAGDVEITQHGVAVDPDSDWRGPIRIRTTTPKN
jgi:hypothetical protein